MIGLVAVQLGAAEHEVAELAAEILDRPVRVGRPLGISGLPEAAKGPAFGVAAGLLVSLIVAFGLCLTTRLSRRTHRGVGRGFLDQRWLAPRQPDRCAEAQRA